MINRIPVIGVMGASAAAHADLAEPVGRLIAQCGFHVLTGAGPGVMESVLKGFTSVSPRAGLAIGVVPGFPQPDKSFKPMDGHPNPYVEIPIYTPLGIFDGTDPEQLSRNHVNILTSTRVIALPGSKGTRNEVMLAQLHKKPLMLYGPKAAFELFPANAPHTENFVELERFVRG